MSDNAGVTVSQLSDPTHLADGAPGWVTDSAFDDGLANQGRPVEAGGEFAVQVTTRGGIWVIR